MPSLQERVTRAIVAEHGVTVARRTLPQRQAAVAIRMCSEVVRDFPLNICGYGGPMPADHAASVEDFRRAVLAALGEENGAS
jgi:hypothetical protein